MEDGGMEGRQDEYQARMASLVGNLTGDTGLWLDAGKERKGKERKGNKEGRNTQFNTRTMDPFEFDLATILQSSHNVAADVFERLLSCERVEVTWPVGDRAQVDLTCESSSRREVGGMSRYLQVDGFMLGPGVIWLISLFSSQII
jgi:hypothetical protein